MGVTRHAGIPGPCYGQAATGTDAGAGTCELSSAGSDDHPDVVVGEEIAGVVTGARCREFIATDGIWWGFLCG